MGQLGMGVMLHMLGGGSKESADKYYGKRIRLAEVRDNTFFITFEDGIEIKVYDDGQSCCEARYMTCDDDLGALRGERLRKISVEKVSEEGEDEVHEIAFLTVKTDKSTVTFCTHNEHNGYYGGFGLSVAEVRDAH